MEMKFLIGKKGDVDTIGFEKLIFYITVSSGFIGSGIILFELGPVSIFPYRLFIMFLLFLFVLRVFIRNGRLVLHGFRSIDRYILFFIAWLVYALVSMAWAADKIAAFKDVTFLILSILIVFFFIYYVKTLKGLNHVFAIWCIALGVMVLLGFWEHLTGMHLPVSKLYETTRQHLMFVPTGVYHNQNDFATYLALSFPFVLSLWRYSEKLFFRCIGLLLSLSVIYLIIVIGSRANLAALIFGGIFLFLFLSNFKYKFRFIIVVLIISLVGVGIFPNFLHSVVDDMTTSLRSLHYQYEENVGSVATRINLAKNGMGFVQSTGGLGVGAGNAEYYMKNYSIYPTGGILNPHNWWLEILINYGLIIFIGYVVMYISIIFNLIKYFGKLKNNEKMVCEAIMVSLVIFFFASMSSSSIMAFKPQWFLFGTAIAFLKYYRVKQVDIK